MKNKYLFSLVASVCLFSVAAFGNSLFDTRVALLKAQDELRFDVVIIKAAGHKDALIRKEAALAAGRIGDEKAVPLLVGMLGDVDEGVAQMAMFGIGEIESLKGLEAVNKALSNEKRSSVAARAVEAAGKIVAANREDKNAKDLGAQVLEFLKRQDARGKMRDELGTSLALTAVIRARPEGADLVVKRFLDDQSGRIRGDAANTLARLRSKNANKELLIVLTSDSEPVARANAARVLGGAEDKSAIKALLKAATTDEDRRVRTNAVSALGNLKDKESGRALVKRGNDLFGSFAKERHSPYRNELLSIASALGRIFEGTNDKSAKDFLTRFSSGIQGTEASVEIAMIRVSPASFAERVTLTSKDWRANAALAQALGFSASLKDSEGANKLKTLAKATFALYLKAVWEGKEKPDMSFPAVLNGYAAFKTDDLAENARMALKLDDVVIRSAAASILGGQEVSSENQLANYFALRDAFENAEKDKLNDAELSALNAIKEQYSKLRGKLEIKIDMLDPIKKAYYSPDYLVRRQAREIAKEVKLNMPEKANLVRYAEKGNARLKKPDYKRALKRKTASAKFETAKGSFTIEFDSQAAPLTVENFIQLAKSGYFNGLMIHRVIPNFVMQDGDPRGDGSGGPGWHIRCEINQLRYERGSVGMALAGKDTGGSQWFVAHSPQPHLDGGYTVFGMVNETGMKIVDNLARGDVIKRVRISE